MNPIAQEIEKLLCKAGVQAYNSFEDDNTLWKSIESARMIAFNLAVKGK